MAHSELDLKDRRKIEDMLRAKVPVDEIAVALGRHRSTIYREIGRNRFADAELPYLTGYWGVVAQNKAVARRVRRRKLIRLPALLDAVVDRLKAGWSPEQIAGRLRCEGQAVTVSHETIYAHVYSREGRAAELARHLPDRRRQRRSRFARRPQGLVFPPERAIQNRPAWVKDRSVFGDWEGDLMIFRREHGLANVASLVERKTRYAVLFRNNDRSTRHLMDRLMTAIAALPQAARRSITFDRGIEFSGWRRLQNEIGTEAWFCDPQEPWQKGAVENFNKRARRYLPRETVVAEISVRSMVAICAQLNNTPRKCLGWQTPTEAFRTEIMNLR